MSTSRLRRLFAVLLALSLTATARAQRPDTVSRTDSADPAADGAWPSKFRIGFNEFNLGFTTFVLGAGFLIDYATHNQDSVGLDQIELHRMGRIRDSRLLLSGTLRTKRPIVWQSGLMYDWPTSKWLVRQTMIRVSLPEILGTIDVGRMKEGLSQNRVMTGYDGWTTERFTFSDAAIPLLADGIKWLGYAPSLNLVWNLGAFTDHWSEGQTFSYYEHQVVGRLAYVRMKSPTSGHLLHFGAGLHVGKPTHDTLQLKSKPEMFASPNFIDTGKFPARLGRIAGLESYYRNGPWLFGAEYYGEWVDSKQTGDPFFHGGDVVATWIVTGETRPYTTTGGNFRAVKPARPVFRGGPGAWETVLRVSYSNLDAGTLTGGTFWRVTPMVNWHMTEQARLAASYGFSVLDRFGKRGTAEFFQLRLQLQLSRLGASSD